MVRMILVNTNKRIELTIKINSYTRVLYEYSRVVHYVGGWPREAPKPN